MISKPPILSSQERAAASARARDARKIRAEVRAGLAAGVNPFQVINHPSEAVQRMRVLELLTAVPGVGPARATAIMERNQISLSRRIGGLGRHQLQGLRGERLLNKSDLAPGKLIVISGPGGVGKSTITKALATDPRFWVSVSATTRAPRPGEQPGRDYFFVTEAKFDQMVANGEFLEWAEFAGNRYGTPRSAVSQWLNLGRHVILEIEIAGARQIKNSTPGALLVFIAPPSWEQLRARLAGRGTDSDERQAARLALAELEMAAAGEFDRQIINDTVDGVVAELVKLLADQSQHERSPHERL